MKVFVGHEILVGTKFWTWQKFFVRHRIFFVFVFLLWSEYFVSILMIGQLCFAKAQESR